MCTSAPFMTFFSNSTRTGYTWRPDCNNWACDECRPNLEQAWIQHASAMFQTCPSGIGYLCVRLDQIQATMKRLNRAGTQYLRVRGHGLFHLYLATPALGQRSFTTDQAIDLFSEHVALAPAGQGHVISTSRGWRRSHSPDPQEATDLRCVVTRVGPDAIRSILDTLHQTHSTSQQTLSFRLDSDETLAAFLEAAQAEKASCPYSPSYPKKRKGISDKRPMASTGTHRLPPNPAVEALRSP